ncbi:MAG: HEAT repeat domain-containing protein [Spirochaetota bacterium]
MNNNSIHALKIILNISLTILLSFALVFCTTISVYSQNDDNTSVEKTEKQKDADKATEKTIDDTAATEKASEDKSKESKKEDKKNNDEKAEEKPDPEDKNVKMIEKTLKYGIHKNRTHAIKMILSLKKDSSKKHLVEILNEQMKTEENMEVKKTAITTVAELGDTSAMPWIIDSLDDQSDDVQIAAVYAIKRMKYTAAKDTLIKKFKEQDLSEESNLTEALIHTLGELDAPEITSYVIESIKDTRTTNNNRQLLVLFLGNVKSGTSKDFLVQLLKDSHEDKRIRAYAANSLAHIGDSSVASHINKVIDEIEAYPLSKRKTFYNLHIYCVASLAKLGDESAIPRLEDALQSDNAVVRLRAIKLIQELKTKRTIDILKYKMEYDPSPKVQNAAKEALKEMGVEDKKDDNEK